MGGLQHPGTYPLPAHPSPPSIPHSTGRGVVVAASQASLLPAASASPWAGWVTPRARLQALIPGKDRRDAGITMSPGRNQRHR